MINIRESKEWKTSHFVFTVRPHGTILLPLDVWRSSILLGFLFVGVQVYLK